MNWHFIIAHSFNREKRYANLSYKDANFIQLYCTIIWIYFYEYWMYHNRSPVFSTYVNYFFLYIFKLITKRPKRVRISNLTVFWLVEKLPKKCQLLSLSFTLTFVLPQSPFYMKQDENFKAQKWWECFGWNHWVVHTRRSQVLF